MRTFGRKARSALWVEAAAALALLGLTLALTADFTVRFYRAHEYFTSKRAAQLAAEGYLERIRAGELIVAGPVAAEDCPPWVSLVVTMTSGEGAWSGLHRVGVVATTKARHGMQAKAELFAYFDVNGGGNAAEGGS